MANAIFLQMQNQLLTLFLDSRPDALAATLVLEEVAQLSGEFAS